MLSPEKIAEINQYSSKKLSALIYNAVENNNVALAEFLLSSPEITVKRDIRQKGDLAAKDVLFMLACIKRNVPMVEMLLNSPKLQEHCKINSNKFNPITYACFNNDIKMIECLLFSPNLKEHLALENFDKEGNSFLTIACCDGQINLIKFLLTTPKIVDYAHINLYDNNIILETAKKNHKHVVDYLINGDYIKKNDEPLHINHADLLIKLCFDRDEPDCINKRWDVIEYLIIDCHMEYEPVKKMIETSYKKDIERVLELFQKRDLHLKLKNLPEKLQEKIKKTRI